MSHPVEDIPSVQITKAQVESQLPCSVCLEEYKINERVVQLPCGHVFHSHCISTWLLRRATCPICRCCAQDGDECEVAGHGSSSAGSSYAESIPEEDDDFTHTDGVTFVVSDGQDFVISYSEGPLNMTDISPPPADILHDISSSEDEGEVFWEGESDESTMDADAISAVSSTTFNSDISDVSCWSTTSSLSFCLQMDID